MIATPLVPAAAALSANAVFLVGHPTVWAYSPGSTWAHQTDGYAALVTTFVVATDYSVVRRSRGLQVRLRFVFGCRGRRGRRASSVSQVSWAMVCSFTFASTSSRGGSAETSSSNHNPTPRPRGASSKSGTIFQNFDLDLKTLFWYLESRASCARQRAWPSS